MADPLCPLGEPPVERVVSSPEAQNQALFADLRELLASGIEPDRILLISTSSLKGSSLQTWPQDLPIARATAPGVWPPEHIHFDTVHQVKGLEADVVFLIDIHTNTAPECVYTGASRARHRLYVYKDHLGALEAPEL
jgi:hypothetical protein